MRGQVEMRHRLLGFGEPPCDRPAHPRQLDGFNRHAGRWRLYRCRDRCSNRGGSRRRREGPAERGQAKIGFDDATVRASADDAEQRQALYRRDPTGKRGGVDPIAVDSG